MCPRTRKQVGACASCPSSTITLKFMIRNLLMHRIPEIEDVLDEEDLEDDGKERPVVNEPNWTG
jgi:Fe-S cluster biogenesis protein NfuA